MPLRTRVQFALTLPLAVAALFGAAREAPGPWLPFLLLTTATVLCSGLKIRLPNNENSLPANFPFLALALVVLSPVQALLLAALSAIGELFVTRPAGVNAEGVAFNAANAVLATTCAAQVLRMARSAGVPQAIGLMLAGTAFFAFQTLNMTAVAAPQRGKRIHRFWFVEYLGYLPFYLIGALLAALTQQLAVHSGWSTAMMLIPGVYTMYRTYMDQLRQIGERRRHLRETEALHVRIIESLAMAIEAKDQNTHEHLFRVRHLAQAVGTELGLDGQAMRALQTASFLHDIGKLAVPEHILNKPGRLTPEEFEILKIHPRVGAEILERIHFPYPVVPIVRSHHEWWNGAGYPDGLRGDAIPIGARILTVIDCFDALTSDRPYRKGMSDAQAMEIIEGLAGTQFDPNVVKAFAACELTLKSLEGNASPEEVFTALNTELEVLRGFAPGAGFEAGSEPRHDLAHAKGSGASRAGEVQDGVCRLVRAAAARAAAQSFFELTQNASELLAFDELFALLAERLRPFIPHDACVLHSISGRSLLVAAASGHAAASFSRLPFAMGAGISGWVAQQQHPLINGNCDVEPSCPRQGGSTLFHSALAFPLLDTNNQVFAVLTLYARVRDAFHQDQLHVLHAMGTKLSMALSNALASRGLSRCAAPDPLSGIESAHGLVLALDSALKKTGPRSLAVLCCCFTVWRASSSRRGRVFSDRLLSSLVNELRRGLRPGDVLGRLGEDEFVFVIAPCTEADLEQRRAEIGAGAQRAWQGSGTGHPLPLPLGAAMSWRDGVKAEALLAQASRRAQVELYPHTRGQPVPFTSTSAMGTLSALSA